MKRIVVSLAIFAFLTGIIVTAIPKASAVTIEMERTLYADTNSCTLTKDDAIYTIVNLHSDADAESSVMVVGQWFATGIYYEYRVYLYFDTSIIPDTANITDVTLSLYVKNDQSTKNFNITIQNGQPTWPHKPIWLSDYYYGWYSGNGGTLNTSALGAGYNNITLNDTGKGWLKIDGFTKLCIRSDRDINGIAPTGKEYVEFYDYSDGESKMPRLYISYETEGYSYTLHGAYNEEGIRNGAINTTLFKTTEAPETFEVDGVETKNTEATPTAFKFNLGDNESRIYYIKDESEDIYIFNPSDPYTTYYVTIVDYLGIHNAYLETLINVNGTDRIVERQKLNFLNDVPFILSWGTIYKFRLVCSEGTYVFGERMAGADTEMIFTVTGQTFPPDAIHIGNITVSATRVSDVSIQVNYTDAENLTYWVYVAVYRRNWANPTYTENNTGSYQSVTWSEALPTKDYIVKVTVSHQEEGELSWTFSCPAPFEASNPWDFSWLGNWPVDSSQILGFCIVLAIFAGFSQASAKAGIIATVLTACILTYIGFLNINWTWLSLVVCIAFLMVFSLYRKEVPE